MAKTLSKPRKKRKPRVVPPGPKAAPANAAAAKPAPPARSLLTRPLGLEGWERLEPVLLAALASEEPMLLVGRHGTAKSFLLERLAQAMGLVYRFYNASLIDFDDLAGIPVPTDDRQALRYIHTPTAIWDAEVVFVDEINRTKPELQNKLFPIIHERRLQGVRLEKLRYRWAAMNPSFLDDDEDDAAVYVGAEPLDPALADRFTYLIEVPTWEQLSGAQKRRVLLDQFRGRHEVPVLVAELVAAAAGLYAQLQAAAPVELCEYLDAITGLLNRPRPVLSARRATMLFRSILAVQSARATLASAAGNPAAGIDWETSAYTALLHGHPGLAHYGRIDAVALLSAHKTAWRTAGMDDSDPWKRLLKAANPVERLALALELGDALGGTDLGQIVSDTVAAEPDEARRTALALAAYLAVRRRPSVPAGTVELLARDARRVLVPGERSLSVGPRGVDLAREVGRICSTMAEDGSLRDRYARNLLNGLLPDGYGASRPEALCDYFRSLWDRLVEPSRRPGPPSPGDDTP